MKKFLLTCLFFVGLLWAIATFSGLANQGKYDSLVLDFKEDVPASEIESQLKAIATNFKLEPHLNSDFSGADNVYVVKGDAALLQQLRATGLGKLTESMEPNYIYETYGAPNDPRYVEQWNLRSINIEEAWRTTKGKNITVAVIDTGVSKVKDLKDTEFVKGYDFVNDRELADDDNGHGTHVAGTIAQSTNNNYGVAGIAYQAKIMPLKVLASWGGGTITDIAEAIRFAADHGADVINMSLGGGGETSIMREAIEYAHQKGVVIIAAAGNSSENAAAYPARYPHVVGVSATGPNGEKSFYSNYGAGIDIAAPGGNKQDPDDEKSGILQNTIDPQTGQSIFAAYQGTSMASPHVAGVAALVKAAGVNNPDEIEQILLQSARTIEEDGLNYYGSGQLDAAAAVDLATKGRPNLTDFFRWLRDNGYLSPKFWFDGGVVALIPKLLMVVGGYLLAKLLQVVLPFRWNWSFNNGIILGSSGLFFLRGFYIFDLPQWPFRVMGSSIAELGTAVSANHALNPITASVLVPFLLLALLLGHPKLKWFAIGSAVGITACLAVSAVLAPELVWLGSGIGARGFLAINAVLCLAIAYLSLKSETTSASA
ncbi:Thermitase [Thalassoporum mexicanum PCC 7367]|uniref:S8 family peptidase n=1 Tax=Thalassoporum mexicanum TaxID=3457544 RepID=UPI00029FAD9C|nr:S8 family peptidase [Pseudanabaena sp. PCC 7367]AFY71512.1 Thermitase [Pseudanabaena sp. PCC 7367]